MSATPVTLERVSRVLSTQGWPHETTEYVITGQLEGYDLAAELDEQFLVLSLSKSGIDASATVKQKLLPLVQRFNITSPLGTLQIVDAADGASCAVLSDHPLLVIPDVSDRQLQHWVTTCYMIQRDTMDALFAQAQVNG